MSEELKQEITEAFQRLAAEEGADEALAHAVHIVEMMRIELEAEVELLAED